MNATTSIKVEAHYSEIGSEIEWDIVEYKPGAQRHVLDTLESEVDARCKAACIAFETYMKSVGISTQK